MPVLNPFPLNIPLKVNSPELLAFFQQFGIDKYLSADEINKIKLGLDFLYENVTGVPLDGLATKGTITRAGNVFTFSVGFSGPIVGVTYANAAPVNITIPTAAAGTYRIDYAVLNTSNNIVRVAGTPSTEIATEPDLPENTIFITKWLVFGDFISDEAPIIDTSIFVPKQETVQKWIFGDGQVSVPLNENQTNFILGNNEIEMIEGTEPTNQYLSQFSRPGKILSFFNKTDNPVTFKHSLEAYNFRCPNNENYIAQPGEYTEFKEVKDDGTLFYRFVNTSRIDYGSSQNLEQTLELGDRGYRQDIGTGLTPFLLSDRTKVVDNTYGDDHILMASMFRLNDELVIKNSYGMPIKIYGTTDIDTGDFPSINGNAIDETTYIEIPAACKAFLKKYYDEDFIGEFWMMTLQFENAPNYPVSSVNGQTGVVTLTKTSVGLGNVDNTADVDKPVSTPQQNAINSVKNKPVAYIAITSNIALSGNPTINSVTLSNGLIVLLTNQTDGKQNGLWEVQTAAWVRPSFFAVGMDVSGAVMPVQQIRGFDYDYSYVVRPTVSNIVGTNVLTIDVLYEKDFEFIDMVTSSDATGVTSEIIVKSYEILGKKTKPNSILKLLIGFEKTIGVNAGTGFIVRHKINTVNDFSSAVTIMTTNTSSTFNRSGYIERSFEIKGGNLRGYPFTTASFTDVNAVLNVKSSTPYNPDNTYYHFISIQQTAASEGAVITSFKLYQ